MMDTSIDMTSSKMTEVRLSDRPMKDITNRSINEDEDESNAARYNELISKAKKLIGEGQIEKAVVMNKKALKITFSEKLAKKIRKMEEYLKIHADDSEEEEDNGMTHLGKGFYVYKDLYSKLYAHQQLGVLWMWSLFRRKKGGILGDDMGLGKTIQVIAFLSGLFDMQMVHSVLIVLPVALMVNWEKEFNKWAPGLKVVAYHGNSKREKWRALARVQKRGGICLTTYGLVVTSWDTLGKKEGREFVWDYMILDEGHKIKNPTKTSKGVHAIPATHRLILTGTPVQNNLKELWALFDFVHQGSLLGTQRTFKLEYDNPITRAREKDATAGEKILGMQMAESLKQMISPYFLRRTKAEVKESEQQYKKGLEEGAEEEVKHAVMPNMTRKNDLIVWTFMREAQLKIYQDFLSLDSVKELLMTTKSPLVALNVLKKICDHPRLLSTKACAQLGIEGDEHLDDDFLETEASNESAVTRIAHVADNLLINESGKLLFLVQLLDRLKVEGHRCLVFSQSRKMLDIMEKVFTNKGHKIMRLDGTITQVLDREARIQKFQTDPSYNVFLLTTQVGGVGLTLTAANRVVIFDPSWNPATDAQAVDRAFRIGQEKNVVIYRLITCGTVEEKIYRRQVFKDSITRQTTGNAKNPYRYFSKSELRELFKLNDPHSSSTQQQLESMHSGQRMTDLSLDAHIAFLYSLEMFGLSDHDLMFTQGAAAGDAQEEDEENAEPGPENDYILHRVQKAQELLQMESSQAGTLEERLGKAPGVSTGALAGLGNNRNQFTNWEFPKPTVKDEEEGRENEEYGEEGRANEESEEEEEEDVKPVIKEEPVMVDLTEMGSPRRNFKQEPIDLTSPVMGGKPFIKTEPGVTTPNNTSLQNMSHSSYKVLVPDSPFDDKNVVKTEVEDTPNRSVTHSHHSYTSEENVDDSIVDEALEVVEESVIMDNTVSDTEIEEGMGEELRGILEKSLCQSIHEMTDTDSPIAKRPARKSISSGRRNVIESSDDEGQDDENETEDVMNVDEEQEVEEESEREEEIVDEVDIDNEVSRNEEVDALSEEGVADDIDEEVLRKEEMEVMNQEVEEEVQDESMHVDHGQDGEEMQGNNQSENEETGSEEEEEEEDMLDFHDLSEDQQRRYNELVETGRLCCQQKRYEEGQAKVLQALDIYPDPELQATAMIIQRKIMKQQLRMTKQ